MDSMGPEKTGYRSMKPNGAPRSTFGSAQLFDSTWRSIKRIPVAQMLAMLGIVQAELELFKWWFVVVGFPYLLQKIVPSLGMHGNFFHTKTKQVMQDGLILDHLLHNKYIISTERCWAEPPYDTPYTQTLTVDLDRHPVSNLRGGGDPLDFQRRLTTTLKALGTPDFMVRSSESGGMHLYYCFSKCPEAVVLGRVRERLALYGESTSPGHIELYPSGAGSHLRLPFGWGSWLLNQDDLSPITDDRRTHRCSDRPCWIQLST